MNIKVRCALTEANQQKARVVALASLSFVDGGRFLIAALNPEATALSLMLAVIAASDAPLVLLNGDLKVVAASASFCRAFQIDAASVTGSPFSALGQGEWDVPQLSSLLEGTASGAAEVHAYEFELNRDGQDQRLLVLNAHKLDYDDKDQVRVLLAVADVTEARASEKLKDNLLREKAILLQEVQPGLRTVSRSSPASSCRAPARFSLTRPVGISATPTAG